MINRHITIILICIFSNLLNASILFGREDYCSEVKYSINQIASRLFDLIDSVEICSVPAESFRDKVFSNLKYRSSRLKKCVRMVQSGNFGFDCSRELRKTLRSQGGDNCGSELEDMNVGFKYFLELSLKYKTCLAK